MKRTMKNYFACLGFAVAMAVLQISTANGQSAPGNPGTFSEDDNYSFGWHELTLGGQSYFANVIRALDRPNLDYSGGSVSGGFMFGKPRGEGILRGNFELMPEAFGYSVFHGPGHYIAGGTLWLRYNFVPQDWRLVPYIQLGAGVTSIDIPHQYDGQDFNFNLDAAIGLHYFIQPRIALNAEYRFQHISNADTGSRNIGVNASGPAVGISFFF